MTAATTEFDTTIAISDEERATRLTKIGRASCRERV